MLVLAASCAATPPAAPELGEEAIGVATYEYKPGKDPLTGNVLPATREIVAGATCSMTNDKGTWTTITPNTVKVNRSMRPLRIQCEKDGYQRAQAEAACLTREQRSPKAMDYVQDVLGILTLNPLTLPMIYFQLTEKDDPHCYYGGIVVTMTQVR